MGTYRRKLASAILRTLPKFSDKTRIEAAGDEDLIHFHWRDLRIILSPLEQFQTLHSAITKAYSIWEGQFVKNKDFRLSRVRIPEKILFGDELKIEETTSGIIHFHYRDMRLELSPEDFLTMARIFTVAADVYSKKWEQEIRIDEINPGDKRHQGTTRETWRRGEKDWDYHQEGIRMLKDGIGKGGQILPILIMKWKTDSYSYQRLDGFKRLAAYKELGREKIPCFVVTKDEVEPIRQDSMPFWRVTPHTS